MPTLGLSASLYYDSFSLANTLARHEGDRAPLQVVDDRGMIELRIRCPRLRVELLDARGELYPWVPVYVNGRQNIEDIKRARDA